MLPLTRGGNPYLLPNPDADIRYLLPDMLSERSAGTITDNVYDYMGDPPQLMLFLNVLEFEAALACILDVVEIVRIHSRNLWLAYETIEEPSGRVFAVIQFLDVIDHRLSPINDEGLGQHPCASAGLKYYAFNEVVGSKETQRWTALWYKGAKEISTAFEDTIANTALSAAGIGIGLLAESLTNAVPVAAVFAIGGRAVVSQFARSRWKFADFLEDSIESSEAQVSALFNLNGSRNMQTA